MHRMEDETRRMHESMDERFDLFDARLKEHAKQFAAHAAALTSATIGAASASAPSRSTAARAALAPSTRPSHPHDRHEKTVDVTGFPEGTPVHTAREYIDTVLKDFPDYAPNVFVLGLRHGQHSRRFCCILPHYLPLLRTLSVHGQHRRLSQDVVE